MILVDTSVWIDHLRRRDEVLVELLGEGKVLSYPFVIGELHWVACTSAMPYWVGCAVCRARAWPTTAKSCSSSSGSPCSGWEQVMSMLIY